MDNGGYNPFPNNIQVRFALDGEYITLNLRKNDRVNENTPIYLGNGTEQILSSDVGTEVDSLPISPSHVLSQNKL